MPFADYKNFADCVSQNQDKDSPEGYCADIHKQATGKYPAENAEQINVSTKIIYLSDAELATMISSPKLKSLFSDTPTRIIKGVQIFKAGTHKDSMGREREWTTQELGAMVEAFTQGRPSMVPVKLGHTSAEHNDLVAKELGIPASVLSGEGSNGHGAANLGKLIKVRASNGILTADIEVPEKIAALVESGMFGTVSSEINENYQDLGPAISGLALLGSERPALKNLKPLSEAKVHSEEGLVYVFSMGPEFTKNEDKRRKRVKKAKTYAVTADQIYDFVRVPSKDEVLATLRREAPDLVSFVKANWDVLLKLGVISVAVGVGVSQLREIRDLEVAREARRLAKGLPGKAPVIIEGVGRVFSQRSDQIHHFIFRSGRAKDSPEVIYQVPITETSTTENGQTSRKVIVQHVRANTISEARGVAFSALQSILGAFGGVFGAGLGALALILIQERFGLREKIRFNYKVGDPTVVPNATGDQRREAEQGFRDLQAKIIQGKGRVFQDSSFSSRADFIAPVAALAAAVQLPFLVIGAVTLKNIAFEVIAKHNTKNQVRPVRVYVDDVEQVEPAIKKHLGSDWKLIGKVGLAVGGQTLKDTISAAKLGFTEQVDLIHHFVSLQGLKNWLRSNFLLDPVAKLTDEDIERIAEESFRSQHISKSSMISRLKRARVSAPRTSILSVVMEIAITLLGGSVSQTRVRARASNVTRDRTVGKLGKFAQQSDLIYHFVSLRVVKTGVQQGAGQESFVNYALLDATTQRAIGSAMVTHFPEQKELVIDWIEGALGLDGVRQFIRTMKADFPGIKKVLGARASGAKAGLDFPRNLATISLAETSDQLHDFTLSDSDSRKYNSILRRASELADMVRKSAISISDAAAQFEFLTDMAEVLEGGSFRTSFGDVPLWRKVAGIRNVLASQGFVLSEALRADELHQFHTVHPITRRILKPHSHRGERVSAAAGAIRGAAQDKRIRRAAGGVARTTVRVGLKRRFFTATADQLAERLKSIQ